MANKRDYYEVLGVGKNATDDEIILYGGPKALNREGALSKDRMADSPSDFFI